MCRSMNRWLGGLLVVALLLSLLPGLVVPVPMFKYLISRSMDTESARVSTALLLTVTFSLSL